MPRLPLLPPIPADDDSPTAAAMAGSRGRCSPPPIRNADPRCHECSAGVSSSRRPIRQALRLPRAPRNAAASEVVHRCAAAGMGTRVAEITDRHTHEKLWLGSFHSAEEDAKEYGIWSARLHGADDHQNFEFDEMSWLDVVDP